MFARLDGKPEPTLEKTRELTLLHWGTLGLYLHRVPGGGGSFLGSGVLPLAGTGDGRRLLLLLAPGGQTAPQGRRLAGACRRLGADLMIYVISLGRVYTAANVATIVAAAAA